jgi:hypothetical protein
VLSVDEARRLALALPEATEQDHHGRPSFRVDDKIFATLWTPEALNVMAGEELIVAAVEEAPGSCSKVFWGKRLSAVQFDLTKAEPEQVERLLHAAWSRKAPRACSTTESPTGLIRLGSPA